MPAAATSATSRARALHPLRVDAEGAPPGQHFAAEFQQDALVCRPLRYAARLGVLAAGFRRRDVADFEAHEAGDA